ncbi:MAG: hypothetical protein AB7R55_19200 [Gemmatimonadales bacterium]
MGRTTFRPACLAIGLAALTGACQPEAVLVSDTESWTLQLEQLDDGQATQGRNVFPIPNVLVQFGVELGGGSVTGALPYTGPDGEASVGS